MIAENLHIIRERIENICDSSGRRSEDVTLVAVSKNFGVEEILSAYESDQRHFGESKAQEFRDKIGDIPNDVIWHFIGHLQRNKVKYVVPGSALIHSVDSLRLAKEIQKQAAKAEVVQHVLLEVKTSEEESKFGLEQENSIFEIAEFIRDSESLQLDGLMTIAPYTDDKNVQRRCFGYLRELKERMNKEGYDLKELSMGMTGDYETAIEEGSTIVRIGTAIFGERQY